jgi:endoglucanase
MKRYAWFFATVAAASLVLFALASSMAAPQQKFVLRVNAGDEKPYKDKAGNVWQVDKEYKKGGGYGFLGGDIVDRGADMKIAGATDPRIYQTEHYSMDGFTAEVPNGTYTVRMHFAETYEGIDSEGPRVFDVKLQGQVVLKDFDPQKTVGGVQKPLMKEFKGIAVTNGLLQIVFVAKLQNPEINGIEIIME